jgi:hypothetical protein
MVSSLLAKKIYPITSALEFREMSEVVIVAMLAMDGRIKPLIFLKRKMSIA